MPITIRAVPINILAVNGSFNINQPNSKPNTGTSNVEIVAVTMSITLNKINQTVKQSAEANTPVNKT